jgi:bacterioferritin
MQGDANVIGVLNDVLTAELTSVNQYFLDSKMFANWGYGVLAKHFYDESIDEMKDADALIERILFLDGLPNVQRLSPVHVGENPTEKLEAAKTLEVEAVERLNQGIATCVEAGDDGSRQLLSTILEGEERHLDWVDTQLGLVAQLGETAYLAQQLGD